MSALRGVAVLGDLPPLADVLVGVDGAVREVFATSGEVRDTVPAAFDAGAKALARAAREVVDQGRPAAESEEAAAFAELLLKAFASSGSIVPVESLFYDDAGPHVVREGVAPAGLSRVEAVSQGEYLAGAAGGLQRAASPLLRDLRLFGMAASLRPLAGAGGSTLASALGRLSDAGRGAIERGAAAANLPMFVALIAQAAEAMRTTGAGDDAALGSQLDSASAQLSALAATPAVAPAAPLAEAPAAEVPLAEAPAAEAPAEAPSELPFLFTPAQAAAARASDAGSATPLAAAYTALERLTAAGASPPGSLDDLFGAPVEEGVVPIEALAVSAPEEEARVVPVEALAPSAPPAAPLPPDDADVVPIESLLYSGPTALERALALRREIETLLATKNGGSEKVGALLREVFDLVQLGLGASH